MLSPVIRSSREASELLQLLYANLLDLRLPDLVWHPCWGVGWLVYLHTLSLEYVYFLRASLTELDICKAPIGRFQRCLPGRFSGEDCILFALLISEGEVPGFLFFFIGYGDSFYFAITKNGVKSYSSSCKMAASRSLSL